MPAHFANYNKIPIYKKLNNLLNNNKPLKINSKNEFVGYILNNFPMTPPNYEQIKKINNNLIQIPLQEGEKLEFGPNRCASK